jgi:hypothetical protein
MTWLTVSVTVADSICDVADSICDVADSICSGARTAVASIDATAARRTVLVYHIACNAKSNTRRQSQLSSVIRECGSDVGWHTAAAF